MDQKQRTAVDRLQAEQNKGASSDDRKKFLRAIAAVPKQELETAALPPKEKRGRKPAPKP